MLSLRLGLFAQTIPSGPAIDTEVGKLTQTHAKGLAVAVIDCGKVSYIQAYYFSNVIRDPLTTDTDVYGASLTEKYGLHKNYDFTLVRWNTWRPCPFVE